MPKYDIREPKGQANAQDCRIYGEGRDAAVAGKLIGDNPYPAALARDNELWANGFNSWATDPSTVGYVKDTNCHPYGGGYVPP